MTAEEREEEFRKDFERLLEKHGAHADYDHDTGLLSVTMWTVWNKDGITTEKGFAEFDL